MAQSQRPEQWPEPESDALKAPLEEFLDATRTPINSSDLFRSVTEDPAPGQIRGSDPPTMHNVPAKTVMIAAIYAAAVVELFVAAYLFASGI